MVTTLVFVDVKSRQNKRKLIDFTPYVLLELSYIYVLEIQI